MADDLLSRLAPSPENAAAGARQELQSMGGAPQPGPQGFAATILPMLGKVLGTTGLLAASAAIPGFGQAYVQAQQHAENQAAAQRGQLLRTLDKEPSLIFQPGMEPTARKTLGPQLTLAIAERARSTQAEEAVQQAMAQFAGRAAPEGPVAGPSGETVGLVPPGFGGLGMVTGQGVQPIFAPGALAGGQMQESATFNPKGEMTRGLQPTPAAEKERQGRIITAKQLGQHQRQLMEINGWDSTTARTAAVHAAARRGDDISQLSTQDQGLLELADPQMGGGGRGAAAQRTAETTTAAGQAKRDVALTQPPKGDYVNPQTLELYPAGVNLQDIEAQGGIAVDPTTKRALVASRSIEKLVSDIDRVTRVLFPFDDPMRAGQRALKLTQLAAQRGSKDPEDKALVAALTELQGMKARAGQLAQTVGGETGGRLSDQDIQRVFTAIPGLRGDVPGIGLYRETSTSAQQLVQGMRSEMLNMRRALLGLPLEGPPVTLSGGARVE